jgi:hypothetical protein
MDQTTLAGLRQGHNVAGAALMPLTTFLAFGRGVSFDAATAGQRGTPSIEPAGYAFVIWGAIYIGRGEYALFQASAAGASSRCPRIGWWTHRHSWEWQPGWWRRGLRLLWLRTRPKG